MIKGGKLTRQQFLIVSLLLAVVFVVFILPNIVTQSIDIDSDTQTIAPVNSNDLAPSAIAEKTRYRQQSQSLLALILSLRDKLQSQSVDLWAQAQFKNTMALIAEGDDQYSYGKYQQSLESYNRAYIELQELEILATEKLEQSLAEAEQAIKRADNADIDSVQNAVFLTLAIAPQDPRVQDLDKLAAQFSDLVKAISQGDQAFARQQYELAKGFYQTALTFIPEHQRTKDALGKTQAAIEFNTFTRLMSEGYSALDRATLDRAALEKAALEKDALDKSPAENSHFDKALEKFNQAQAIYSQDTNPNNLQSQQAIASLKSVEQALAQLNNQRSQYAILQQLRAATELEKQELWQQAELIYQNILKADPTLVDVKTRLIQATVRAKLNRQIVSVLEDPLTLADQGVYANAQQMLADAQGIKSPQVKLKTQIEQLSLALERSKIPTEIVLLSDQQTQVTVYQVAKLGAFRERRVQLLPGRYTIAGSRKGYRDVQIELKVHGTEDITPIQISCTEKI